MSAYVLSVDADFDLDDIWEYIATDNVDAADRWIGKLFDAFDALGRNPGMGHRREDLTSQPVLFWPSAVTSSSIVPGDQLSKLLPLRRVPGTSRHS